MQVSKVRESERIRKLMKMRERTRTRKRKSLSKGEQVRTFSLRVNFFLFEFLPLARIFTPHAIITPHTFLVHSYSIMVPLGTGGKN